MREVICADALEWMRENGKSDGQSFVTSMPDISEFNLSLSEWKTWFIETATLVLKNTDDDCVSIFYQSDIKVEGTWVDKSYLCMKAAENLGHELLWHKIICRVPAGMVTMGRPSYSHILCFSKNLRLDAGKSSADVLPDLGEKNWERGMGEKAAQMISKFISEQTKTSKVINPFCGQGMFLAHAESLGLDVVGIERSPKRAENAKKFRD